MSADLSQAQLTAILATTFAALPEHRRGQNCIYALAEAAWGAFIVFFSQARSFLARRRDTSRANGRAHAASLLGVVRTPSDPQMRNLLDPLAPEHFSRPFQIIWQRLKAGGYLQPYQAFANHLLISLDGVHYFSSTAIHCPQCNVTLHGDQPHYSHAALLPVLVAPDNPPVISLEPEFITLKNHGYHLEHNYGHGYQHLAPVLVVLHVLAFLLHTVMDLTSEKYRRLRQELGARMTFFDDIRTLLRYWQFGSWEELLDFMLMGLGLSPG